MKDCTNCNMELNDIDTHCFQCEQPVGPSSAAGSRQVDEMVSRLTLAREAAYTAAESFKLANNRGAEAQCFSEGIGMEKAIAIVNSGAC